MPSAQVIDLSPGPSALELTVSSFTNRMRENQKNKQDTDALSDIYKTYKEQGQTIDDAIMAVQTRPDMSPTARANAASTLLNMKKTNTQLQREQQRQFKQQEKENIKLDKEKTKAALEADMDQKELDFLEGISGKDLKPTELYIQARKQGIDRTRAHQISTLHRLQGKEDRLTENDIAKQYDFELKELDREIKEIDNKKKSAPQQEERKRLMEMRKRDIQRYRNGDRDFEPELQAATMAKAVEQEAKQQEEQDPVALKLAEVFPPAEWKGKSKWDKAGNEYKSDGKKWVIVRNVE